MNDMTKRVATRRHILTGAAALLTAACTHETRPEAEKRPYPADDRVTDSYRQDEITGAVSNFFGTTSQGAGEMVEHIFSDLGKPNAYIAGDEAAGAIAIGLRYGHGWLYRRGKQPLEMYWRGPSIGFDLGANASKCFTLVYNLDHVDEIFQRFPGVDGSYYFIAGIGVNYMRASGVTLAPMRTGVGLRAGINAGYLNYSREDSAWPF